MKNIIIPKDGASDTTVRIISINKENGEFLQKKDYILEYETSKSVIELYSDLDGYIYNLFEVGTVVDVGEVVSIISEKKISKNEIQNLKKNLNIKIENEFSKKIITKKAKDLISKNEIDIRKIDLDVITEDIVKLYLEDKKNKQKNLKIKFSKNDIVLVGIGGHASMCIDIIISNGEYDIKGFVDDNTSTDKRHQIKYLGTIKDLDHLSKLGLKNVILGIGFLNNLKKREQLYEELIKNFSVPTIIHKSSIIEKTASIGFGCQIMAGSIIGSNVKVDDNTIVNSGAIISHDSTIDSSSHVTPGAIIAGHVKIGKRVTIGMGASVYINCKINNDIIINNNESVIDDR